MGISNVPRLRELLASYRELAPGLELSVEELMNPLLDFPREAPPEVLYAIYSPQRTGSHLLCQYLFRMRVGIPLEYFNWRLMRELSPRLGCDLHHEDYHRRRGRREDPALDAALVARERRYLDALVRNRSWNGNAFGFKLQGPQGASVYKLLLKSFSGSPYRFVLLRRRDLLAGAASLHFSKATGMWTTDQTSRSRQLPVGALLDPVRILESHDELQDQHDRQAAFVGRFPGRCATVFTEDLIASPVEVLAGVLEHLGVAPRPVPEIPAPKSAFEGWRREMIAGIRKVLEAELARRPAPSQPL